MQARKYKYIYHHNIIIITTSAIKKLLFSSRIELHVHLHHLEKRRRPTIVRTQTFPFLHAGFVWRQQEPLSLYYEFPFHSFPISFHLFRQDKYTHTLTCTKREKDESLISQGKTNY